MKLIYAEELLQKRLIALRKMKRYGETHKESIFLMEDVLKEIDDIESELYVIRNLTSQELTIKEKTKHGS